jgi:hypothetical protein
VALKEETMFMVIIKWKDGTSSSMNLSIQHAPANPTEEDFKDLLTMTKAVVDTALNDGSFPGRSKKDLDTIEIITTSAN